MVGSVTCPLCQRDYPIDSTRVELDVKAHLMTAHPKEYQELKRVFNILVRLLKKYMNGQLDTHAVIISGVKF